MRTLKREVIFEGIGIHTGEKSKIIVRPSKEHGIKFFGKKIGLKDVKETERRIVLEIAGKEIHTVEHLLSALYGLNIDSVDIEIVEGKEIPSFDGSALKFAEEFERIGFEEFGEEIQEISIKEPVTISDGRGFIGIFPSDKLEIEYSIAYDHPFLKYQKKYFEINPQTYKNEIAPARTIVFEEEIETIREKGLGKGGSEDNVLVIKKDGYLQKPRFEDEPVRHKILDLIGDLCLLNRKIKGKIVAYKSGHNLHHKLLKEIEFRFAGEKYDFRKILELMPHRYPFLLIDKILYLDEERVVGLKNVTFNEPFFQGHFPGEPVMPGVLIIEALAQTGGFLLMHKVKEKEGKLMLFMGIDEARFKKPVRPGDTLYLELELLRFRGRIIKMKGEAKVNGETAASAILMATIIEKGKF